MDNFLAVYTYKTENGWDWGSMAVELSGWPAPLEELHEVERQVFGRAQQSLHATRLKVVNFIPLAPAR
jgi:hypothetical protein